MGTWHYLPDGATTPIQIIAPLLGGIADGEEFYIGFVEELPDCLERHGENCIHYYALERRGSIWVFCHCLTERRAGK